MTRAQVLHYGDIDPRFPERNPESSKYKYKVLAEGDSWFTLGAVPSSNLLFQMEASRPMAIVSIAEPGDTIVHMGNPRHMQQLQRLIAVPQFSYAWDAILLSGGGNDLIDSAPVLLRKPDAPSAIAADYVDPAALDQFVTTIQTAYANIVAVRDSPTSRSRGKPIFLHTYDYPIPRDSPARFLGAGVIGPWLYHAFLAEDIPESMWVAVSDYLVDRLADALLALDSRNGRRPLPNVNVVDTRNTLSRARLDTEGSDADWENEIHPNTSGYRKLAVKISARMGL